jgi:hypothetical protein
LSRVRRAVATVPAGWLTARRIEDARPDADGRQVAGALRVRSLRPAWKIYFEGLLHAGNDKVLAEITYRQADQQNGEKPGAESN